MTWEGVLQLVAFCLVAGIVMGITDVICGWTERDIQREIDREVGREVRGANRRR